MSVADADCHVFGGHVLAGCEVRTTAEVVLGVLSPSLQFRRAHDARTGYDELFFDESGGGGIRGEGSNEP